MTATESPTAEARTEAQKLRSAAVDALVKENLEWARALAREVHRKLPPSFDPGDLESVALIEMWERAKLYDPDNDRGTPFRGFAYQYVRGAVLMSVRRKNFTEATHDPIPLQSVCPSPAPDQVVAAKQQRKNVDGPRQYRQRTWLLTAIDRLKSLDAYMVYAVYIHEREVAEVAKLFGLEPSQVSRRLAGIVKRLRRTRRLDLERAQRRRTKRRRKS